MNVPFPPLWLLPFPFLWIAACVWSLRRSRAVRDSLRSLPASDDTLEIQRGAAARLEALRVRGRALNGLILAVLALYELVFFTAPPVRGRVIELQTGKPIAGGSVTRQLSQVGLWRITEGPAEAPTLFSTLSVRSDRNGDFTLPGWINLLPGGLQGLSGMSWVIFESGWMPAYGCVSKDFHPWGAGWIGCGAFNGAMFPDPWVLTKLGRLLGWTTLEVRVSRPTLDGVTFGSTDSHGRFVPASGPLKGVNDDPWGEYFRRLNILTQFRYLKRDEFIQQAVEYVSGPRPLSDAIAFQVLELVGAPIVERPIPYDRDRQVLLLRKALLDYCDQTPESDFCRRYAVGLSYIRKFFLQKGASAQ